jgi:hypothetical protein
MQNALSKPTKTGTGNGPTGSGSPSGSTGPNGEKPRTTQAVPPRGLILRGLDNLGPSRTDALPIPLLVLAGLGTLLLLTAGGLAANKRIRSARAARPKPPTDL